jgi:hypothetical protein
MLAHVRLLACIVVTTPGGCAVPEPCAESDLLFSPVFVLARLIYLFMVRVFGWLVLLVRSDAAARSIDVAAETAVTEAEGASLEQAAAEHEPLSGGGRCLG